MNLKHKFEIVDGLEGCIMAVPICENNEKLHIILKLNEVSANIIKILNETSDINEIKTKFISLYPNENKQEVIQILEDFLDELYKKDLLVK